MNWQIFVGISVFTYAVSVILQRNLLKDKKIDPVALSIVFQILTGLIISMYALYNGFRLPDLYSVGLNVILMMFLYGLGNVFIFKSLANIDASEFTVLFTTRTLWSILAALLFLNEKISAQNILGAVLIILGVIITSYREGKRSFTAGQWYALLAGFAFGLAFVNDAYIIQDADVPSYLSIAFVLPGLLLCLIYPRSIKNIRTILDKHNLQKLFVLDIFYAVSAVTIFLAYQLGKNATQIAPLNQTSTIITVLLGILFLGERQHVGRKIIGVLLSFTGVLLLI